MLTEKLISPNVAVFLSDDIITPGCLMVFCFINLYAHFIAQTYLLCDQIWSQGAEWVILLQIYFSGLQKI